MLLVLVLGVGMGWYARSVTRQLAAVAAIKRAGGSVDYDINWGHYNPDILDPNGRPRAPKWLAERLGVDYVGRVVYVDLMPTRFSGKPTADDKTLAYLSQLDHLENLILTGTAITDAGMAHIEGLKQLRNLELGNTKVTDRGLKHLKGMTQLGQLSLYGSKVSDEGVLDLEVSLPRVQVIREDDLSLPSNTPAAKQDLAFILDHPTRQACKLLANRAMASAYRPESDLIATVNALCDLKPSDKKTLEILAAACSQCFGVLDASRTRYLTAAERLALQNRCADRGVAALSQAIDLGYKNLRRLDSEVHWDTYLFGNLRSHPGYPKLVNDLKAKIRKP